MLMIPVPELLLPLTSAASLPIHPSLSIAYTSPTLTDMAQHACETVQKERKTLANAKQMMLRLRGDETWSPCSVVHSKEDKGIFNTEKIYQKAISRRWAQGMSGHARKASASSEGNVSLSPSQRPSQNGNQSMGADETGDRRPDLVEVYASTSTTVNRGPSAKKSSQRVEDNAQDADGLLKIRPGSVSPRHNLENGNEETRANDDLATQNPRDEDVTMHDRDNSSVKEENVAENPKPMSNEQIHAANEASHAANNPTSRLPTPEEDEVDGEILANGIEEHDHAQPSPRRMRTRAQAQAVNEPIVPSRSETPESWVQPEIHPLFMIPALAVSDRDFGLPAHEAEETRRLLNAYVQKQEEICRGSEKLHEGLIRADRQRKEVLKWCKAEGHVGEMSDGEDWYDKEEWGLEADLEKGQNEDDGDNGVIQGKKTRGRRA